MNKADKANIREDALLHSPRCTDGGDDTQNLDQHLGLGVLKEDTAQVVHDVVFLSIWQDCFLIVRRMVDLGEDGMAINRGKHRLVYFRRYFLAKFSFAFSTLFLMEGWLMAR